MLFVNKKEKWWFYSIRRINLLAYHFWWLFLVLFLILLLSFLFFCMPLKNSNCAQFDNSLSLVSDASRDLDSCCNCEPIGPTIPCNTDVASGGQGYYENIHDLGSNSGSVIISYDFLTLKDRMDVYYQGELVASTYGLVNGKDTLRWDYEAKSNKVKFCKVVMSAPIIGTGWNYVLGCPK